MVERYITNKYKIKENNKKTTYNQILYPLNEYHVNNILDGIQPVNYRVGKYMNGIYMVINLVRVDNRRNRWLKERMVEHLKEYTLGHYFK